MEQNQNIGWACPCVRTLGLAYKRLCWGSMAIPAPSILLVPPHPSSHEDPIYIKCMAPGGFPGANFTLYQGEMVVQLLQAPADQFSVIFNLSGGSWEAAAGTTFHCQYGVLGEHRLLQLSDLSETVHVSFPVPPWILALSLSLAGALLLAGLVAVAVVIRKVKAKKMQKKREQESCWAQINFTTTDMSFDNSLFAISTKMTSEGDTVTLDAHSGSAATPENCGPRKRPNSTSSSPEPPEFSTFRACQ
ncbi:protein HIDE1 isoform X1 [Phyllostomus discolor]|uniref:Protein HIDE1 isoform X1 n=2 Tax=Phyllostomus discolor TaxID=89673 RepID=A0A7E6EA40_9CHIR|nr:protein HIDE1 isoform X1 [Phyllostomus discolor]